MYFVWALALTGLLLIFLEFFLPTAIMAIGGSLLLLTSLFFFHMADRRTLSLLVYSVSLMCRVPRDPNCSLEGQNIETSGDFGGVARRLSSFDLFRGTCREDRGRVNRFEAFRQVSIEDRNFEAFSKTGHIDKGDQVKVLSGKGTRLLVKALHRAYD